MCQIQIGKLHMKIMYIVSKYVKTIFEMYMVRKNVVK